MHGQQNIKICLPLSVKHNVDPTEYTVWIQAVYFCFPFIRNTRYTVWYLYPVKQARSTRSSRAVCWLWHSTVEIGCKVIEGVK